MSLTLHALCTSLYFAVPANAVTPADVPQGGMEQKTVKLEKYHHDCDGLFILPSLRFASSIFPLSFPQYTYRLLMHECSQNNQKRLF